MDPNLGFLAFCLTVIALVAIAYNDKEIFKKYADTIITIFKGKRK